jgi:hypothetical protein
MRPRAPWTGKFLQLCKHLQPACRRLLPRTSLSPGISILRSSAGRIERPATCNLPGPDLQNRNDRPRRSASACSLPAPSFPAPSFPAPSPPVPLPPPPSQTAHPLTTLTPTRRLRFPAALLLAAPLALLSPSTPQLLAAGKKTTRPAVKPPAAMPVLVELFTSEGCSSCPTADVLLARLLREQPIPDAEILAMEEHVDYWDSLGWHDRFASHRFSTRQGIYSTRLLLADEYTPQMIVDGRYESVGSDVVHALHAIAQAAATPKLALTLSPLTRNGAQLSGAVTLPPTAAHPRDAELYAALVQPLASTRVLSGENIGRTLNHVSVVLGLECIAAPHSRRAGPQRFTLAIPPSAATADLRVVVFLQRTGQGAVLGAAESPSIPAAGSTLTAASSPGDQ